MKFSKELERQAIREVTERPETHLNFSRTGSPMPGVAPYQRDDGAIAITRDGLQEFLHRYLFRRVIDADLGRLQLTRVCDYWGCANPFHYRRAMALEKGSHERCPNGHLYEGNTTPSGHCRICAERRQEKRRTARGPDAAALNAAKEACPHGHLYDEANTYLYLYNGYTHRRCRACNAERAAERRRTTLRQAA